MLKTLFDPVVGVPKAVEGRHFVWPTLALCLAVSFSGLAFASRLDPSSAVFAKLEESGELTKASEREVSEALQQAQRIALVGSGAKGVLLMPLMLLAVAVALKICAWLIGRKLPFSQAFTVAAVAFLPVAVFHVLYGAAALRQAVVSPSMAKDLIPSSLAAFAVSGPGGLATKLLAQLDFFNLWAAGLLGLGLAAGTKLRPYQGLLLALLLYVLLSGVVLGLPGLLGGPGQGGGPS